MLLDVDFINSLHNPFMVKSFHRLWKNNGYLLALVVPCGLSNIHETFPMNKSFFFFLDSEKGSIFHT